MKTQFWMIVAALVGIVTGAVCFREQLAEAAGHITYRNVAPYLRTARQTIVFSDTSTSAVVEGTNRVVAHLDVYASGAVVPAPTDTSIDMFPYPCKLDVGAVDSGQPSGAITCTSVLLVGYDQFGNSQRETISTITETLQESTKVFASLTAVSAAGCAIASGGDTNDDIRIVCSGEVGLPMPITSEAAILQFCIYDTSADDTLCFTAADLTTDLIQSSVETDGLIGGGSTALVAEDVLQITVRSPAGL